MTQLSRPYQVALAAIALLGLVWAIALHGHTPGHGESTGSTPSPSTPAPNAQAEAKAAAAPTPIYHGAAPGVEGLTRAIAKAHEAVATSQQNAQQLQRNSREASQEAPTPTAATNASTAQSAAATHAHEAALAARARQAAAREQKSKSSRAGSARKHATVTRPAQQVIVEQEVAAGKTVLLLFWTPSSSVDREVRGEAAAIVAGSHGRLALHVGRPSQVGKFGTLTEVVHVYQTPTILIVNRRGVVSTVTGLTDTFALQQLVHEAERADG